MEKSSEDCLVLISDVMFQKTRMVMKHLFGSCLLKVHVETLSPPLRHWPVFLRGTGPWWRVQSLTFSMGARKTEMPVRMKTMVPVTLCSLADKGTWSGGTRRGSLPILASGPVCAPNGYVHALASALFPIPGSTSAA